MVLEHFVVSFIASLVVSEQQMPFNHENLKVYQRTLPFNVKVGLWIRDWDSRHALCDQLSRAAASMLENAALTEWSDGEPKARRRATSVKRL